MTNDFPGPFARQYETHHKHLKLKGLQPKTIDAYRVFYSTLYSLGLRLGEGLALKVGDIRTRKA